MRETPQQIAERVYTRIAANDGFFHEEYFKRCIAEAVFCDRAETVAFERSRRLSFRQWLYQQEKRNDAIGDFARDYLSDEDAPKTSNEMRMQSYLSRERDVEPKVIESLWRAHKEFIESKKKEEEGKP